MSRLWVLEVRRWLGVSEHYDTYKAKWRDQPQTTRWLRRMARGDSSLAFPQGQQSFGDLGADVDRSVSPDLLADIERPPFKPRSFDTVYCDPPYSMCAYDKIHSWLPSVWEITDKRLIVTMPAIDYNLNDAEYELYYEHNGTATCHLPLFHVWDRKSRKLSDFGGGSE